MPAKRKLDRAVGPALQAALNASGFVGTWETDLAARIIYISDAFAGLAGLTPAQAAAGVPLAMFFDGIHADDRERVRTLVDEAHRTAGRFEAEFRTLGLDGTVRWVAARGQVECDADGAGLRCLGVAVDVTDTRRAEGGGDAQAIEVANRAADALIRAKTAIDVLGTPILRTLVDLLLLEIGTEIARHVDEADPRRLH